MKALVSFLLLAVATAALLAATDSPEPCSTDTECAALCPETDLDCDGGPESKK